VLRGHQSENALGVVRVDGVELGQVAQLDLFFAFLEQRSRVQMQIRSLRLRHDADVELAALVVLARRALVAVVALARHHIGGELKRSLRHIRAVGWVRRANLVVRRIRLLAAMVGAAKRSAWVKQRRNGLLDAHVAVEVVRRDDVGHERAVNGYLLQVSRAHSVVLGIAVAAK
jgi:hypothetical protein